MTPVVKTSTVLVVALCLAQVFSAAAQFFPVACVNSTDLRCPDASDASCTVYFDSNGTLTSSQGCDCVAIDAFSANCTNGLIFTYTYLDNLSAVEISSMVIGSLSSVATMEEDEICRTTNRVGSYFRPPFFVQISSEAAVAVHVCFTPVCTCSAPTNVPDPAGVFCPGQTIPAPTNITSPRQCPVSLPVEPIVPPNATCGFLEFTYNFVVCNEAFPVIRRVTVGDSGPIFNASTCAANDVLPKYTTTCNGTPRPLQIGYPGGCKVQATYTNICGTFKLCDNINLKASCVV